MLILLFLALKLFLQVILQKTLLIYQTDIPLDKQIFSIAKLCFLQLRDFRRIRSCISKTVLSHLLIRDGFSGEGVQGPDSPFLSSQTYM